MAEEDLARAGASPLPAPPPGSNQDLALLHAATAAQRDRLVALRADGTIGDAAFQRIEQELDRTELGWQQVLPEDRRGR